MLDLAQLVDEESDYLYRYALRHFHTEDIAQELVQETFLAAVQSAHRFAGDASPRTWLTSILRHKIVDRIRRKSREHTVPFDQDARSGGHDFFDEVEHWKIEDGPLPWGIQPDTIYTQKEFLRVLESCLTKVPERVRSVFLLREVDGYDQEEICKEFEVSATNLRVMLHRVRVELRNCLQINWLDGRDSNG